LQNASQKKKREENRSSLSLSLLTRFWPRFSRLRDAAASAGLQRRRRAAAARRRAAPAADDAAGAAAAWSDDATVVDSPTPRAADAPSSAASCGLPPRWRRRGLLPWAAPRSAAPDYGVQGHQGEVG
jgi:hypothetical protein